METAMLDSQASKIDMEERSEILSMLPPLKGKDVIELSAGIGQFTGDLAKSVGHMLATDFMEDLIKKNEDTLGDYKNIDFKCADFTSSNLDTADSSADPVFCNWLLTYLLDQEVAALTAQILKWLKPGGFMCWHLCAQQEKPEPGVLALEESAVRWTCFKELLKDFRYPTVHSNWDSSLRAHFWRRVCEPRWHGNYQGVCKTVGLKGRTACPGRGLWNRRCRFLHS